MDASETGGHLRDGRRDPGQRDPDPDDVLDCARKLTAPGIRVLLLHGKGHDERRAFVQAGLMPFLESGNRGYSFLRPPDGPVTGAGNAPLASLAAAIHGLTGAGRTLLGRREPTRIDLSRAWSGERDLDAFLSGVERSSEPLVDLARAITGVLCDTLVIFVDRVGVVTASGMTHPGVRPFLAFLRAFALADLDAKIVVSVDTEALTRVMDAMDARGGLAEGVAHHGLGRD